MGQYGIRIKDPDFSGIGFDYKNDNIDEYIMIEKAKLCAIALQSDKQSRGFYNVNDIKYVANSIKQYLIIKQRKKFESWVEDGVLYLDEIRQNSSKYEIENSIETYEKFMLNDLEMMYIFALMENNYFSEERKGDNVYQLEVFDIIDEVKVDLNKLVSNLEEDIESYVAHKIAQLNFDKIIPEKEYTIEDIENNEE